MKNQKSQKATMLIGQLIRLASGSHPYKTMKEAITEQRRVVSSLFCECVGHFPSQEELEQIDPIFRELVTKS